jgi:hypothetical protein
MILGNIRFFFKISNNITGKYKVIYQRNSGNRNQKGSY